MRIRPLHIALILLVLIIAVSVTMILRMPESSTLSGDDDAVVNSSETVSSTADGGQMAGSAPSAPSSVSSEERRAWELRIDESLTSQDITNDQAAEQLMDIAGNPSAPSDLRLDALEHGLNLLRDENYEAQITELLDASPTAEQRQTIIHSLHGRRGAAQIRTALAIARQGDGTFSEEAYDLLVFLVNPEEEIGKNWQQWDQEIEGYLKEQGS